MRRLRPGRNACLLGLVAAAVAVAIPVGAAPEDNRIPAADLARVTQDYTRRLEAAAAELSALRARVGEERAPLADGVRALEDRARGLEAEVARLEALAARADADRKALQGDIDLASRNIAFVTSQAREALAGARDGLRPGESQDVGERIAALEGALDRSPGSDGGPALVAAELILGMVRQSLGGHAAPGEALRQGDNRVTPGRFVFFGPEVFFLPSEGGAPGVVRARDGAPLPTAYPISGWEAPEAAGFFQGADGVVVLDGSGGKALRFLEAKGTVWTHIAKGGVVGYVILALGGLGLVIALFKVIDLARNRVDAPAQVEAVLGGFGSGGAAQVEKAIGTLSASVRELFAAGLRHIGKPREIIEEHLYAQVLQQRLRQERRLPLLAVIVTAAPLLGLLGTVTGMVKTFTLITIYGTGNASRLSSGISEALVTTELGLMVAIPILVVHGYLAHRMRKNVALLDRYSYEFLTTVDETRSPARVDAPSVRQP